MGGRGQTKRERGGIYIVRHCFVIILPVRVYLSFDYFKNNIIQ